MHPFPTKPLGRHVLIELWGCNPQIDNAACVESTLTAAVAASGATLLHLHVHQYAPQGVTGVAVLAESHFSIHTWPECEYVAADIFTCGDNTDPHAALAVLKKAFTPERVDVKTIDRGVRETAIPSPHHLSPAKSHPNQGWH